MIHSMNRLSLFFGVLVFLVACTNSQPESKEDEKPSLPPYYFYYPKANVYFDSTNKDYFFQSNDGLSWQTAKQIPAVVLALMDKGVMIQNPPDPVWRDNESHRLVYSAVLYATPDDTLVKKKVDKPVRKPVIPIFDSSATIETKERKGLEKLLNKIFGRDKKKKQSDSMQKE